MVSLDQINITCKPRQNSVSPLSSVPDKITKDKDEIAIMYNIVPGVNHHLIHLFNMLERPACPLQDSSMVEVLIPCEEYLSISHNGCIISQKSEFVKTPLKIFL